jgi:ketosteroid isomerase-like protein
MRRLLTLALLLAAATTALAATPADEVRAAETAFAQAFAARDAAKFLSRNGTLAGREAIIKGWTPLVTVAKAPFSWHPERIEVNGAGDLGQKDGAWNIIFDGPGSAVCSPKG